MPVFLRPGIPGSGFVYGLYQKQLRKEIAHAEKPRHVAMILDGNRRWAKLNSLESVGHGHRAGAAKIREFLEWCDDLGIDLVTLYLLSKDNLTGRASDELSDLIEIIAELADDLSRFRDWQVMHVGSDEGLPQPLVDALDGAENRTATKSGMHVNLAVGYGGRSEIADAVKRIIEKHQDAGHSLAELADNIDEDLISEHLYTGGQPDPDLVIRTSGEQRLSDFMLWQSAHSEFYFMEALGPDIRQIDFLRALRDYSRRQRRFGS